VLEVGLCGLVRHTCTSSLTGLKPYHHLFLTTGINRNSSVVTKRMFWAHNITHTFAYSAPQTPQRVGEGKWEGRKGERKRTGEGEQEGNSSTHTSPILLAGWGRGRRERQAGWRNKSIPVLLFPTSSPGEVEGLVVVVPRCLCAAGLSVSHTPDILFCWCCKTSVKCCEIR